MFSLTYTGISFLYIAHFLTCLAELTGLLRMVARSVSVITPNIFRELFKNFMNQQRVYLKSRLSVLLLLSLTYLLKRYLGRRKRKCRGRRKKTGKGNEASDPGLKYSHHVILLSLSYASLDALREEEKEEDKKR